MFDAPSALAQDRSDGCGKCGLNEQTPKRRRYATFDAMRGAAAIAVVIGHFDQVMRTPWPPYFFMAVDLFFLLSGFVLAMNYDRRFEAGMTAFAFMRIRAIRLWPLVLVGAAIGLINQLDYSSPAGPQLHSFISFALTCLALPSPPQPYPNLLFPLNTVFWTLMLEFWVANLVFAVLWKRLHGLSLCVLIGAGALGLLVSERVYHGLAEGWGWDNAGVGLARVTYAFFLGVALGRRFPGGVPRLRLPSSLLVSVVLVVVFVPDMGRISGVAGLFYVMVLLPLLVVLGAGAAEGNPQVGAILGDASYAVYAIHYPLIVAFSVFVTPAMLAPAVHGPWLFDAVLVGFVVAVTALALAIDRCVDWPARRWLTDRFMALPPLQDRADRI